MLLKKICVVLAELETGEEKATFTPSEFLLVFCYARKLFDMYIVRIEFSI